MRDTFAEASQALGYDMWDLIQNGEQEALNLTETTQPVLLDVQRGPVARLAGAVWTLARDYGRA